MSAQPPTSAGRGGGSFVDVVAGADVVVGAEVPDFGVEDPVPAAPEPWKSTHFSSRTTFSSSLTTSDLAVTR